MKKVLHYKESRLAFAPDELVRGINAWSTKYRAMLVGPKSNMGCEPDIIHFHNKAKSIFNNVPRIVQYHSEPKRVALNLKCYKTVIAQYHCLLPQYRNCHIVRNIINFVDSPLYKNRAKKKIRIGYSPSRKSPGGRWFNKGFKITVQILERLKEKHNIEYDVITNIPLNECLIRKTQCHIIIDECVTGSYHRSALEGAAMGKLTFCYLSNALKDVVKRYGNGSIPFQSCHINILEKTIGAWIERGVNCICGEGEKARIWMEKHWHPKDVVKEFEEIYEKQINVGR